MASVCNKMLKVGESKDIINTILYPENEYKLRMKIGRDAQFGEGQSSGTALEADDPRLALTYHEFPLESLDELLSLAITLYETTNGRKPLNLIDLGSGCGRLVLSAALKGQELNSQNQWDQVHGIEISDLMHDYAIEMIGRGIESNILQTKKDQFDSSTEVYFHNLPAQEAKHILSKADIIFCYSTVFDTVGFNTDLGALVLVEEWSELLADSCKLGTVVVTTDRALNPVNGWVLKNRLDVENPSLLGSTGYISKIGRAHV